MLRMLLSKLYCPQINCEVLTEVAETFFAKMITFILFFLKYPSESFGNLKNETQFRGLVVKISDYPYVVLLKANYDDGSDNWCTGSIIHPQWILTAAHCTLYSTRIEVIAGIDDKDKNDTRQVRTSSDFIIHYSYVEFATIRNWNYMFDYSLVRLRRSLDIDKNTVAIIALDNTKWDESAEKTCTVVGFGLNDRTEGAGTLYSAKLKAYHGNKACPCLIKSFEVHHSICCISQDKEDICLRDSGGPLICDDRQVGIASHSYNKQICNLLYNKPLRDKDCEDENEIHVFNYLCPVLSWIRKYVGSSIPTAPHVC